MGFDYDRKAHSEHFYVALRSHGLRITPQRELIYRELRRSRLHPTADRLFARVQKALPHITLDTVNRTLLLFARIRLAATVEGSGNPRRYDADLAPHNHFHCLKCGLILDFDTDRPNRLHIPPEIKNKNEILDTRIVLTGLCADCRRQLKQKPIST